MFNSEKMLYKVNVTMTSQAPAKLDPPALEQSAKVPLWAMAGFGLVFQCALLMWALFGPEIYISMLSVVTSCF